MCKYSTTRIFEQLQTFVGRLFRWSRGSGPQKSPDQIFFLKFCPLCHRIWAIFQFVERWFRWSRGSEQQTAAVSSQIVGSTRRWGWWWWCSCWLNEKVMMMRKFWWSWWLVWGRRSNFLSSSLKLSTRRASYMTCAIPQLGQIALFVTGGWLCLDVGM